MLVDRLCLTPKDSCCFDRNVWMGKEWVVGYKVRYEHRRATRCLLWGQLATNAGNCNLLNFSIVLVDLRSYLPCRNPSRHWARVDTSLYLLTVACRCTRLSPRTFQRPVPLKLCKRGLRWSWGYRGSGIKKFIPLPLIPKPKLTKAPQIHDHSTSSHSTQQSAHAQFITGTTPPCARAVANDCIAWSTWSLQLGREFRASTSSTPRPRIFFGSTALREGDRSVQKRAVLALFSLTHVVKIPLE